METQITANVNNVKVATTLEHRLNHCKIIIMKIEDMNDVGRVFYFRYKGEAYTGEYLTSEKLYNFNLARSW